MENANADPVTESESTGMYEDEEFYENLEAPKFVDLTDPDLCQPDDGSWFCLKIGCDQNHEQIDPEALNKSFMLRVMAARSPNVRLHKALKRSNGRPKANCPHSAPAKQPRSRLARLSTATEVPDKLSNSKLKSHPISHLKSPQSKKLTLTTIGEKEATSTPTNQDMKSKIEPASGGKNGSAYFSAKPLFSPPQKKEIKEVCSKLRKLNLNNTKRRSVPSRYLGKVAKDSNRSDKSKPNDSNLKQEAEIAPKKNISRPLWKKQHQSLEENSQNLGSDVISSEQNSQLNTKKESLRPTRKSSRSIRKKSTSTSGVEKEVSELLVLKSEKESASLNNTTVNQKVENLRPTRKSRWSVRKESAESTSMGGVESKDVSEVLVLKPEKETAGVCNANLNQKLEAGPKRKSSRPLWKSNQSALKPNSESGTTSATENDAAVNKVGSKSKMKDNSGIGIEKYGLRTISENCDGSTRSTKNEDLVKKEGLKSKARDKSETRVRNEDLRTKLKNCDDNKENVLQNDVGRVDNRKKMIAERKTSSLLRAIENVPPEQVQKLKKPSQVNPEPGAKNKKTTNPKPFRFRTDERGILKEANLEKKKLVQSDPSKEESKIVLRKDTGTERCKGRIVPSKVQCLNKGLTSLASKRKNAPSLRDQKQDAVEMRNPNTRVGVKKISCAGNTTR